MNKNLMEYSDSSLFTCMKEVEDYETPNAALYVEPQQFPYDK
jgi:hypothetical protein